MLSKPKDCRHEPPYPGVKTVLFVLSAPHLTTHIKTKLCILEYPHHFSVCGEWYGAAQKEPGK